MSVPDLEGPPPAPAIVAETEAVGSGVPGFRSRVLNLGFKGFEFRVQVSDVGLRVLGRRACCQSARGLAASLF